MRCLVAVLESWHMVKQIVLIPRGGGDEVVFRKVLLHAIDFSPDASPSAGLP